MKSRLLFAFGLLAAPLLAQPRVPSPKSVVPKLTPEEWSKIVGAPTRVTLNFDKAKPDAVVAELARQTGVAVNFQGGQDENEAVTLRVADKPFWEAMRQVSVALRVEPQQWSAINALSLESGELPVPGVLIPLHPLVTLKVVKASVKRSLLFGLAPGDARLQEAPEITVEAAVLLDPKVDALRGGMRLDFKEVVDEKGNDLRPLPLDFGGEAWIRPFEFSLKWKPEIGRKVARLSGTIRLIPVLKRENWEIPNVLGAKGASKTVKLPLGAETWTLESIEPVRSEVGRQYRVVLRRTPPLVVAEVPELQNDVPLDHDWQQMMRLLDAQGRAFVVSNAMTGQDTVEMVFMEPQNGNADGAGVVAPPAKLSITFPTDLRQVELPFEIKDLPLP